MTRGCTHTRSATHPGASCRDSARCTASAAPGTSGYGRRTRRRPPPRAEHFVQEDADRGAQQRQRPLHHWAVCDVRNVAHMNVAA
eukprot:4364440-Prymnesium_polylepis.1